MVITFDGAQATSSRLPWLHAGVAAAYALALGAVLPRIVAPFVLWGAIAFTTAVVVVIVASCLVGVLVASVFVHRTAARVVGVIGVVPALALSAYSVTAPVSPAGFVVVALAGASSALLAHSTVSRIVGIVLALFAVAIVGWAVAGAAASASLETAETRFGTRVSPFVTEVDGFARGTATPTPMEGIALEYTSGVAGFVLSTEPIVDDDTVTEADQICMLPLELLSVDAPLDAVSCEPVDDGWVRSSDARHEIAVAVDGVIVRAGADLSVDEAVLRAAIAGITPMADDAYRSLLTGR